MKIKPIILFAQLAFIGMAAAWEAPSSECLWYKQPAVVNAPSLPWQAKAAGKGKALPFASQPGNIAGKPNNDPWESQSLPVGNGRIGGSFFGGDRLDRVSLNEVSLWSGGANAKNNGSGYAYGPMAGSEEFGSYQPFGNLYVAYVYEGEPTDYVRRLDLRTAMAGASFNVGGKKHQRECFVSRPDNVLVYTAKTEAKGGLNAGIALTPCHSVHYSAKGNVITMSGTLANGEKFEGRAILEVSGGKWSVVPGKQGSVEVSYQGQGSSMSPVFSGEGIPWFLVQGADSFSIKVVMATNYKMDYKSAWKGDAPANRNKKTAALLAKKKVKDIREGHLKDYKGFYDRLHLDLGKTDPAVSSLPTDERLDAYRKGNGGDPELEATIYQYGRYLLISGSQKGNLPLNLQGIWNDKVYAPWACDYHNNINLQMCYWGAEVANLSECHLPFIYFIRAMEEPLHKMTQKEFGSSIRGWTTRISQNPWGGGGWVKWNPPVNAWYALHVWEHYQFTQDKKYLKEVAYPLLKGICNFWEDHLKEVGAGGAGLLSDGKPLSSKEHPELAEIRKGTLVSPSGWSHEWGPVEDGCMHDQQLIRELFDNTIQAASLLGVDGSWAARLRDKKERLAGDRIGRDGYLQEWIVDRPDMVKGQRHTSHLIGVFPGSSISREKTPELARAAMKSLELRGNDGDNRRSWTWPWRAALWARFGEAGKAYEMVQGYIRYNLLDNLLGNHPPMQMDGSYGMTGGMSEMLLQSHAGVLELLPALPAAWKDGSVRGIRARGDITVEMEWKEGRVTDYRLYSSSVKPVRVRVNGEVEEAKTIRKESNPKDSGQKEVITKESVRP